MIDLQYWTTPNGHKVTMFLEETGLPYRIVPYERQGQSLDDFSHLKRWFTDIAARPATMRAFTKVNEINTQPTVSEEAKKILFGQTAEIVPKP